MKNKPIVNIDKRNDRRIMWILLAFDLPTQSKPQRQSYGAFRKKIMADGFMQLQYSLYGRHFFSFAKAEAYGKKINRMIPAEGKVSLFFLTDRQFELTKNFYGGVLKNKDEIAEQNAPEQLLLF